MVLPLIFVKDLAKSMDLFERFPEIDGWNSAMSNLINLCLCLSAIFLNQLTAVAVVVEPLSTFPRVLITQLF